MPLVILMLLLMASRNEKNFCDGGNGSRTTARDDD